MNSYSRRFAKFATAVARWTGRPQVFSACCVVVVLWALTGPIFGFSDTWQLVINTSTTIITFLMVFLIQNTQNRDNNALHAKLDELIRVGRAHNSFIGIENLPDEELEAILAELDKLSDRLREEAGPGPATPKQKAEAKAAAKVEAAQEKVRDRAAAKPKPSTRGRRATGRQSTPSRAS